MVHKVSKGNDFTTCFVALMADTIIVLKPIKFYELACRVQRQFLFWDQWLHTLMSWWSLRLRLTYQMMIVKS